MTRIIVEELQQTPVSDLRVEIVERKGTGHPDTICDAIMEEVSLALCREYQSTFGRIVHHNTDKALLVAGRTSPRPGGGTVIEPMRLIFGDRATSDFRGTHIDVGEVAASAAKTWISTHLRYVDPEQHILFQNELKSGSAELAGIFDRPVICANDTSAAAGYAPLTDTERLVIAAERHINSGGFKDAYPEAGEDVKVMGYRCDRHLSLTIAIAFVDRHVPDVPTYFSRKENMRRDIAAHLAGLAHGLEDIDIRINTLDAPDQGEEGIYLTVLGTSAENADCGQVGRGNRANGVISLSRPMGTEATAGKNPVSHVGKIYSLLAREIAGTMHAWIPGLAEVNIRLGSRIGSPIDQPAIVSAQLVLTPGHSISDIRPLAEELIADELRQAPDFTARLARGELQVW